MNKSFDFDLIGALAEVPDLEVVHKAIIAASEAEDGTVKYPNFRRVMATYVPAFGRLARIEDALSQSTAAVEGGDDAAAVSATSDARFGSSSALLFRPSPLMTTLAVVAPQQRFISILEIFDQIDTDGNGKVSWEDIYTLATDSASGKLRPLPSDCIAPFSYSRGVERCDNVLFARLLPGGATEGAEDRIVVSSRHQPLEILSASGFTHTKTLLDRNTLRKMSEQTFVAGSTSREVQLISCDYSPATGTLFAFFSDLRLRAWLLSDPKGRTHAYRPLQCQFRVSQLRAARAHWVGRLFAADRGGCLTVYEADRQVLNEPRAVDAFKLHSAAQGGIANFCFITPLEQRVVTAGFDHTLVLTDLVTRKSTVIGAGLPCATRLMEYSEASQSIVTVLVDNTISLWVTHQSARPFSTLVDTLNPHLHPIVGLEAPPGTPLVITTDREGHVKIWDVRTLSCVQDLVVGAGTVVEGQGAVGAAATGGGHHHHGGASSAAAAAAGGGGSATDSGNNMCREEVLQTVNGTFYDAGRGELVCYTNRGLAAHAYGKGTDRHVADDTSHTTAVQYNARNHCFVTMSANTLRIWDAADLYLAAVRRGTMQTLKDVVDRRRREAKWREGVLGQQQQQPHSGGERRPSNLTKPWGSSSAPAEAGGTTSRGELGVAHHSSNADGGGGGADGTDAEASSSNAAELRAYLAKHRFSDLTAFAIDESGRRVFLGYQNGDVEFQNFHGGTTLKRLSFHTAEVTHMAFSEAYKSLVSVSADGSLVVHYEGDDIDHRSPNASPTTFIQLTKRGDPIVAMAISPALGVIACGTRGGKVVMTDLRYPKQTICEYQYATREGCLASMLNGGSVLAATGMCFLGKFPLLATAHASGDIAFWSCRPLPIPSSTHSSHPHHGGAHSHPSRRGGGGIPAGMLHQINYNAMLHRSGAPHAVIGGGLANLGRPGLRRGGGQSGSPLGNSTASPPSPSQLLGGTLAALLANDDNEDDASTANAASADGSSPHRHRPARQQSWAGEVPTPTCCVFDPFSHNLIVGDTRGYISYISLCPLLTGLGAQTCRFPDAVSHLFAMDGTVAGPGRKGTPTEADAAGGAGGGGFRGAALALTAAASASSSQSNNPALLVSQAPSSSSAAAASPTVLPMNGRVPPSLFPPRLGRAHKRLMASRCVLAHEGGGEVLSLALAPNVGAARTRTGDPACYQLLGEDADGSRAILLSCGEDGRVCLWRDSAASVPHLSPPPSSSPSPPLSLQSLTLVGTLKMSTVPQWRRSGGGEGAMEGTKQPQGAHQGLRAPVLPSQRSLAGGAAGGAVSLSSRTLADAASFEAGPLLGAAAEVSTLGSALFESATPDPNREAGGATTTAAAVGSGAAVVAPAGHQRRGTTIGCDDSSAPSRAPFVPQSCGHVPPLAAAAMGLMAPHGRGGGGLASDVAAEAPRESDGDGTRPDGSESSLAVVGAVGNGTVAGSASTNNSAWDDAKWRRRESGAGGRRITSVGIHADDAADGATIIMGAYGGSGSGFGRFLPASAASSFSEFDFSLGNGEALSEWQAGDLSGSGGSESDNGGDGDFEEYDDADGAGSGTMLSLVGYTQRSKRRRKRKGAAIPKPRHVVGQVGGGFSVFGVADPSNTNAGHRAQSESALATAITGGEAEGSQPPPPCPLLLMSTGNGPPHASGGGAPPRPLPPPSSSTPFAQLVGLSIVPKPPPQPSARSRHGMVTRNDDHLSTLYTMSTTVEAKEHQRLRSLSLSLGVDNVAALETVLHSPRPEEVPEQLLHAVEVRKLRTRYQRRKKTMPNRRAAGAGEGASISTCMVSAEGRHNSMSLLGNTTSSLQGGVGGAPSSPSMGYSFVTHTDEGSGEDEERSTVVNSPLFSPTAGTVVDAAVRTNPLPLPRPPLYSGVERRLDVDAGDGHHHSQVSGHSDADDAPTAHHHCSNDEDLPPPSSSAFVFPTSASAPQQQAPRQGGLSSAGAMVPPSVHAPLDVCSSLPTEGEQGHQRQSAFAGGPMRRVPMAPSSASSARRPPPPHADSSRGRATPLATARPSTASATALPPLAMATGGPAPPSLAPPRVGAASAGPHRPLSSPRASSGSLAATAVGIHARDAPRDALLKGRGFGSSQLRRGSPRQQQGASNAVLSTPAAVNAVDRRVVPANPWSQRVAGFERELQQLRRPSLTAAPDDGGVRLSTPSAPTPVSSSTVMRGSSRPGSSSIAGSGGGYSPRVQLFASAAALSGQRNVY